MEKELVCRPVGYIHTQYHSVSETPKALAEAADVISSMWIKPEYREAMAVISPGKNYMIVFWLDRAGEVRQTIPIRGTGPMTGLFSTHAPARPNPIGVSIVEVVSIEDMTVYFLGADMLAGTPVLDIKSA